MKIVDSITNWGTGEMELLRIEERVMTVARRINIREGFSWKEYGLPQRFFEAKTSGALTETSLKKDTVERVKGYFSTLMGWD